MLSKFSGFISSLSDGTFVRFKNREKAAITLYLIVKDHIRKTDKNEILILGIPRGGVIMASTIANKIGCKFDFIVPSRIVSPHNQELTIGAIMNDNKTSYFNSKLIETLNISKEYLNQELAKKTREINEKINAYLYKSINSQESGSLGLNNSSTDKDQQIENNQYLLKYKEKNKVIILIDDGVYTGATMIVAARWILENLAPSQIIIGATVIPKEIISLIKTEINQNVTVESIITPPVKKFKTVGWSYQDFMPVNDNKVIQVLRSR